MPSQVLERSFDFGVAIIRMVQRLPDSTASQVLGRQLLRSATSIAANIEEAQAAVSRADFGNKMGIALKEARETHLWLRFIRAAELTTSRSIEPLLNEADQIRRILGSISKKVSPFDSR
ncbi:MAG: four helix bundle protein [Verrucomicrobiae bacterium]|nr:four helix bundle protein [Verrucomicrobiae bacterium]